MIYLLLGWVPGGAIPRGFSTHTDFTFASNQFQVMSTSFQYEKVTFNRVDVTKPSEPKMECLGKWEMNK